MRILITALPALLLAACASQAPAPAEKAAAPATSAAATAAKPGPQCYSGDHSRFFNVGEKTSIAGVNVVCKAAGDGKAAQWMGDKH